MKYRITDQRLHEELMSLVSSIKRYAYDIEGRIFDPHAAQNHEIALSLYSRCQDKMTPILDQYEDGDFHVWYCDEVSAYQFDSPRIVGGVSYKQAMQIAMEHDCYVVYEAGESRPQMPYEPDRCYQAERESAMQKAADMFSGIPTDEDLDGDGVQRYESTFHTLDVYDEGCSIYISTKRGLVDWFHFSRAECPFLASADCANHDSSQDDADGQPVDFNATLHKEVA